MIERKVSDSMTRHMTMGLGHIISSKFNITQGLLGEGFWDVYVNTRVPLITWVV